MANNVSVPTLMGYLGKESVAQAVETRLFGGHYIRFANLLTVCAYLYENTAILGRARNDNLTILAKTFPCNAGAEKASIDLLREQAQKRLEEFGKERPKTFWHLIVNTELKRLGLSFADTDVRKLEQALSEKFPYNLELEQIIKMIGLEGIGFGSCFPQLTVKMRLSHYFESFDPDKWQEYRSMGLQISERPTIVSLEEQEKEILTNLALFVSQYYPKLLTPLNLATFV